MEEPDPQRRPVVATVTWRIKKELVTLYRARKAENRPRDKGPRFHLQNEELRNCLEAEPNQVEGSKSFLSVVDDSVHRRDDRVAVLRPDGLVRRDLGPGVSFARVDGCKVLGETSYDPSCVYLRTDDLSRIYKGTAHIPINSLGVRDLSGIATENPILHWNCYHQRSDSRSRYRQKSDSRTGCAICDDRQSITHTHHQIATSAPPSTMESNPRSITEEVIADIWKALRTRCHVKVVKYIEALIFGLRRGFAL